jgi:hypothetical protein
MKWRLHHIGLLLLVHLTACKKGIWSDPGPVKVEERAARPIAQILLYDNVNLVLTQDSTERVRVEAPESILPEISTQMDGHSLTIRNRNRSLVNDPDEELTVYVNVRYLQRLDYLGSANVHCTNTLQSPYFTVLASEGSGNLELTVNSVITDALLYSDMADFRFEGRSDSCYTYCNTLGTIDYRNFEVKRLQLDYSGIRDAHVHATEQLNARIFYKGNVYYKGNPVIRKEENSSGRLLPY